MDAAEHEGRRGNVFRLTFGVFDQTTPWGDVRSLDWVALVAALTTHQLGRKEGTCIIPAVFAGTRIAGTER